jgi:Mrp family chromosome partitioning ATPase
MPGTVTPVLLVGCPALASPLRAAKAVVLSGGAEPPEEIARTAAEMHKAGRDYAVLVANPTGPVAAWAQAQIAQRRTVVVLAGSGDTHAFPPAARVVRLPATVDQVVEALGGKAVGGMVGTALVGTDLSVRPTRSRPGLDLLTGPGPVPAAPATTPSPSGEEDGTGFEEPPRGQGGYEEAVDFGGPIAIGGHAGADLPGATDDDRTGFEEPPRGQGGYEEAVDFGGPIAGPDGSPGEAGYLGPGTSLADADWQLAVPEAGGPADGFPPLGGPPPAPPGDFGPEAVPPGAAPRHGPGAPQGTAPVGAGTPVAAPADLPTGLVSDEVFDREPARPAKRTSEVPPGRLVTDEVFGRPAQGPAEEHVAPLVICFAGKGGVGKSTTALALGQQAAEAGLRAFVVDANRGQGDLRKYLRVGQAWLPSVVDAAISGDPARAFTMPERLVATRPNGLPALGFGVVLAPTDAQADPTLVTPEVYRRVARAARQAADLVVVDTQIVEAADTSGMVERFLVPELLAGAWGLGISDTSVGVDNLLRRLYMLSARGVGPERLMVALNRVEPQSGLNQDAMVRLVSPYAAWMGAIAMDPAVATAFESGGIPTSAELRSLLAKVLWRVLGLGPPPDASEKKAGGTRRKRWFSWRAAR